MGHEQPEEKLESSSDRVRQMLEDKNIKVGRKESPDDSYATLVTIKASSLSKPEGLRGRILEVNYSDPEPYLVITVHGYKKTERILLKDILDIEVFEQ